MMNALRAKNKLSFIDGSLSKPDVNDEETRAWEKCNSMVISWIFNVLILELHDSVAYVDTTLGVVERFVGTLLSMKCSMHS